MSILKSHIIDPPFTALKSINGEDSWKVLIVSDEKNIHHMLQKVFSDFTFDDKRVEFIKAYSYDGAIEFITKNNNIAIILIDIKIDNDNWGLSLVKYIRKYVHNKYSRIILMSDSSEELDEKDIILNYDINDYKEKDKLTPIKLFTSIVTALRGYKDIVIIEDNRKLLKKIMEVSPKIYGLGSEEGFMSEVLFQMISILDLGIKDKSHPAKGFLITRKKYQKHFKIIETTKEFKDYMNKDIKDALDSITLKNINMVIKEQYSLFEDSKYILYFNNQNESESIVYIESDNDMSLFDKELLRLFYNNVTIAFENLYLYNEIEDTQREIIYTLGEVAEARSESEIGNHVKRVAMYSELLAQKLGLCREEVNIIKMAAPIHDVGKIAIPDDILLKPGKLTISEYEYMKKHAELGYKILKKSNRNVLQAAAIIAYQHHEKYDGTGYPQRLKGEDIHIYGRITGIADVFDALLSRRVYKPAWKVDDVLNLMKEERGKHFDPILVDILLENIDEMLEIYRIYGD